MVKKVFLIWFFSLFLIFTNQTADANELPVVSSCGLENGQVKTGDGTLCKEDLAFGLLYEMFPSVFNEISPLWNLTAFSKTGDGFEQRELLGAYHGDRVFITLYELFHKIVIFCGLTYVFFLAVDVASRLIRGKSLSDDDPNKDNNKSWATGGVFGAFFMLPYKSFYVGPLIVFSFAVGALSIANFAMSIVLSSQEETILSTSQSDLSNLHKSNPNVIDRHDYISQSYYRYLMSMSICREESSSAMLTIASTSTNSIDEYKEWAKCTLADIEKIHIMGRGNNTSLKGFINIYETPHKTPLLGRYLLSEASLVDFSSDWSNAPNCSTLTEKTSGYSCGRIMVSEPDWGSNPLMGLLSNPNELTYSLDKIAKSFNHNMSSSDIESLVYQNWSEFYEKIKSQLLENVEKKQNIESNLINASREEARKINAASQALLDQNGQAFRQLARFYHQSAQNIITFGRLTSYRELGVEWDPVSGASRAKPTVQINSDMSPLLHHIQKAESLAKKIRQIQCLHDSYALPQSEKTLNFLLGEVSTLDKDAQAKCLDVINLTILEYNENIKGLEEVDRRDYIYNRVTALEEALESEWVKVTSHYASQREGVEKSFKRYIKENDITNWLAKMRQEGYLAIAGYTFHLTSRLESIKRETKLMTNNMTLDNPVYDERYIGQGLLEGISLGGSFSEFYTSDEVFNRVTRSNKVVDPLVDRYFWLVQQSMALRQPTLSRGDDFGLENIIQSLSLPMTYFDRLGLDFKNNKNMEKCVDDPTMCPFPITDPLLELSLMGHDMLDTGVGFYTIVLGLKGVGSLARLGGKKESGMISERGVASGTILSDGTRTLLREMAGLADMLLSIIGTVLVFYMAVGALLAYLLPLLPYIYIWMGYITWVMVVVMASFSIMLWSFFWIRFREKRELIKEAGFHYGVDMLFKPLFNMLSVVFAWALFYMLMFLVGMTSNWITILPLSGEGALGLRALIDPLLILLFIGFVFGIALKFSYQVMDDMSSELLTKLGVRNKSVQDKIGIFIKAFLFDKATEKGKQMNALIKGRDPKIQSRRDAFDNMYAVKKAMSNNSKNNKDS